LTGTVTVLAAASLTTAFDALGKRFEAAHPGARVTFSYGGSSTLAAQLEQGASADVFASADEPSMDRVVKAGLVSGTPSVFAHNRLAIAVAPGNPRHIAALADLARPGVNVSLCQAQVPCGRYAAQSLDRAGVKVQPASQELDVKAVLSRVELGEADAGIVYASDIHAAGPRVLGVDIPLGQNVLAGYPIAALTGARLDAARLFVEFVLGPEGRRVLTDQRFLVP
jgi:molybdate transport system substrate-binding protein